MVTTVNSAVRAMLPNGRAAGPATITIKEESLPVESRKLAYTAIEEAYDIQIRKGGIEDTQNILKGLQDKVGEKVYAIVKDAVKHSGANLAMAAAMFKALCAGAEKHLESKYVEENKEEAPSMGQLIPQWTNYKSILAKGLEQKINPMERNEVGGALLYPTASEYRKAAQATGAQQNTGTPGQPGAKNGVVLELVSRGWSQSLAAGMQVLCAELNRLPHEEQDKFAPRLVELAAEVHTFANEAEKATLAADGNSKEPIDPETAAALNETLADDAAKEEGKARKGGKRRTA